MTEVNQPYQELFEYLWNELVVIATETEMQEIEAIVISKHEQQIKDAYNQGFRDALELFGNRDYTDDVADHLDAQNYYNETFKNAN